MLKIPNVILGTEVYGGKPMVRTAPDGTPLAEIYSVPDADLRRIKRGMEKAAVRLAKIPVKKICEVIKRIPEYYFKDAAFLDLLKTMIVCDDAFLSDSVAGRAKWCGNIDVFARDLLQREEAEEKFFSDSSDAVSALVSRGPAIAVLPKNSDEESLYVVVQCLLARTPVILRASQWGPSSLSAVELIRVLKKVVAGMNEPELSAVFESVSVVNMFDTEREKIIDALYMDRASYILFGSQKTINAIKGKVRNASAVIGLGTGLASAVVMPDADINTAARESMGAVCFHGGVECISTSVIYVHQAVLDKYMRQVSGGFKAVITDEAGAALHTGGQVPVLIRTDGDISETAGMAAYLKTFGDEKELAAMIAKDFKNGGAIAKNIACSLFCADIAKYAGFARELPTYNVKFNKGTHRMNMFLPHQGYNIYRELLEFKTFEK